MDEPASRPSTQRWSSLRVIVLQGRRTAVGGVFQQHSSRHMLVQESFLKALASLLHLSTCAELGWWAHGRLRHCPVVRGALKQQGDS